MHLKHVTTSSVPCRQSAAIVALCNVEVPRLLGDLINVLTHFASAERGGLHFSEELRAPALRLISFYGLQVVWVGWG